jgi:hypothetical protein
MPVSMLSTSLITDPKRYGRFNALNTIYTPPAPPAPGMVLLAPTTINHTGTSASIGTNGRVTFTAVTALSLNGVFSADFDNYVVSILCQASADEGIQIRYRAAGTDANGNNYTAQFISAASTTLAAGRSTSTLQTIANVTNVQRNGVTAYIYGPFLAQPTALRSVNVYPQNSARIVDYAVTHSLSTSYDGISFLPSGSANITGSLQVYGVRS